MTSEELNELITEEGLDRVIADIVSRGYYVKLLDTVPVISGDYIVRGEVRMLDACGIPLSGARVHVQTLRLPISVLNQAGDKFYVGDSKSIRRLELNADGVVRIPLVKGARVIISVEGGFSREVTVPETDFDVLSFDSEADSFIKPALPVDLPIRRI